MTPQQEIVAQQVEEFWRERGYRPSISPTNPGRFIHAVKINDPERKAICASQGKSELVLARELDLLRPPCRRCIMSHIAYLLGKYNARSGKPR